MIPPPSSLSFSPSSSLFVIHPLPFLFSPSVPRICQTLDLEFSGPSLPTSLFDISRGFPMQNDRGFVSALPSFHLNQCYPSTLVENLLSDLFSSFLFLQRANLRPSNFHAFHYLPVNLLRISTAFPTRRDRGFVSNLILSRFKSIVPSDRVSETFFQSCSPIFLPELGKLRSWNFHDRDSLLANLYRVSRASPMQIGRGFVAETLFLDSCPRYPVIELLTKFREASRR